jgi:hypothetical protein
MHRLCRVLLLFVLLYVARLGDKSRVDTSKYTGNEILLEHSTHLDAVARLGRGWCDLFTWGGMQRMQAGVPFGPCFDAAAVLRQLTAPQGAALCAAGRGPGSNSVSEGSHANTYM